MVVIYFSPTPGYSAAAREKGDFVVLGSVPVGAPVVPKEGVDGKVVARESRIAVCAPLMLSPTAPTADSTNRNSSPINTGMHEGLTEDITH